MLFLDGVGIGKKDDAVNPFFRAHLPAFRSLFDGDFPSLHHRRLSSRRASALPLDATLGVAGLPQSGTGQTALFTGFNGPEFIGKHFGPHPYSTLKPVIHEKNIFRQLLNLRKKPYFANAFPQRFFDYVDQHKSRLTVTTLSCMASGVPILRAEDLARGEGISADITNAGWRSMGYPDMAVIDPAVAGRRLARLSRHHDFVLFEYWKTDKAGHSKKMEEAVEALEKLDAMLVGILEGLDSADTLLCITSDHGNIEDMSTKTHTRNPVPAILYGRHHHAVAQRLEGKTPSAADLCAVTPTLLEYITSHS